MKDIADALNNIDRAHDLISLIGLSAEALGKYEGRAVSTTAYMAEQQLEAASAILNELKATNQKGEAS